MPPYTFVHPTKTGGTTLEQYFAEFQKGKVVGAGHLHTCNSSSKPIIVLREPMDRFVSMFRYWRNGAVNGKYTREDDNWVSVNSITDFITKLRAPGRAFAKGYLHKGFTTNLHFVGQSHWLEPNRYADTTVLLYSKAGLGEKLEKLLTHLGLSPRGLPLPRVNVTKDNEAVCCDMTREDVDWVRSYFKKDFELWHLATRHPRRFKKVF